MPKNAPPRSPPASGTMMSHPYRNRLLRLALSWSCFVMGALGLRALRDEMAYALAPAAAPLQLGDATELLPEQIPHNSFVQLQGITEHRGLRHRDLRGLQLRRQELWLFRLLGSRGTFIEVNPDSERFGPTTQVHVQGRAIDPRRAAKYAALLAAYDKVFLTERRPAARLIEVDVRPGEGRTTYLAMVVGVAALLANAALNSFKLISILRRGELS